ncbi:MAG: HlyD family efflux transporter periplasmic adaptor subunit [Acetobacteraceae bacterium]
MKPGDLLYQIEKPPFEGRRPGQDRRRGPGQGRAAEREHHLKRATTLLNTPAGQRSTVDDATATQQSQAALLLAAQAQLAVSQINLGYTDILAPISGKISRTALTIGNVVGPTSGTLATIVSQDPMYVYFPVAVRAAYELRDRYASKGGAAAVIIKLLLPDGRTYAQVGHLDYIDPTVAADTTRSTCAPPFRTPCCPA